jgi:hypothetical protein
MAMTSSLSELLADYRETKPWHSLPASISQLVHLANLGLSLPGRLTRGEASHLIQKAWQDLPPTPRQETFLRDRGLLSPKVSKYEAHRLISRITGRDDF